VSIGLRTPVSSESAGPCTRLGDLGWRAIDGKQARSAAAVPESHRAPSLVRRRFLQRLRTRCGAWCSCLRKSQYSLKRNQHMPRLTLLFFAALVTLFGPALPNDGQITLAVGFAAGGTSSTAARIVAEAAEQTTRNSTTVENRPGAGGAIAADWVRRQKGTPQTLLFMSSTSSLRTSQSGLVPIGILATFPYVAVTRKDAAAHLAEYMEEASREEKYRTVATAGAGSIPHLIGTKLFNDSGVPMEHVPIKGRRRRSSVS
jgi:hypothetical protein